MLPDQPIVSRDQDLKHAAKLLGIYTRQMEALDKHRGKGKQKITVEHVNVHEGGQAIVGTVEAPAKNGSAKKGAAVKPVTSLENKPGPVMPAVSLIKESKVRAPEKARIKRGK